MIIKYIDDKLNEILEELYGDSEFINYVWERKDEIISKLKIFYDSYWDLKDDIEIKVTQLVVRTIKEDKEFKRVSYETFINKFANTLPGGEIEKVAEEVVFMTSNDLIQICEIIRGNNVNDDKKESIKNIIMLIVKRGGGNKKYWRDLLRRVEIFDIPEVNKMIENKIEVSLEC